MRFLLRPDYHLRPIYGTYAPQVHFSHILLYKRHTDHFIQRLHDKMKFSLSSALAAIALVSVPALAQHISIASPQPGATVAPGQQITMEIDRPVSPENLSSIPSAIN